MAAKKDPNKTDSKKDKNNKKDEASVLKPKKGLPTAKIAMGAAGVALAAGVVAAGAMLADKRNREKTAKAAKKGLKLLKDTAQTVAEEIDEIREEEIEAPAGKPTSKSKKTS